MKNDRSADHLPFISNKAVFDMTAYTYRKIDAFTSENSLGNPAACIYLQANQALTDTEMLDISKQHKGFVSEVVFCKPIGNADSNADFELVFFSSQCEVPFCGHGTIACMYSLIKGSPELLEQSEVTIHTRTKGSLVIYNKLAQQDAVFITAPKPVYLSVPASSEVIADYLGIDKTAISGEYPIDLIDAGNRTLIVPIKTLEDEINMFPDEHVLKLFSLGNGIDVILVFCKAVKDGKHFTHTRVFAAKYGYLEDPATGSANSAFGYYMLNNKLWDGAPVTIEQGGADRVFNAVSLLYDGERILFGGSATTRIDGLYYH